MEHLRTPAQRRECPPQVDRRSGRQGPFVRASLRAAYADGTHSFGYLLGEVLKLFVESLPAFPFLLLQLDLIFVPIPVLSLTVTRLIELDVGRFTIDLDVLRLLLPYHDRSFEMDVDDDQHFVVARLEEQVFYVAEKKV